MGSQGVSRSRRVSHRQFPTVTLVMVLGKNSDCPFPLCKYCIVRRLHQLLHPENLCSSNHPSPVLNGDTVVLKGEGGSQDIGTSWRQEMTVSFVPQVRTTGNAFYFVILVFNTLRIIFYFSLCVF